MNSFPPRRAALLARDVYALSEYDNIDDAVGFLKTQYGALLTFAEGSLVKGKTGGPGIIKVRTAFGFALLGHAELKGHAVILFRGTQYLADWLTNGNLSVSRSVGGQPVHDGFHQAFRNMIPQLRQFMGTATAQNVHTFHCIGHSLGGALATLCGEWLFHLYKVKPLIYTFGSPRVGFHGFSESCTNKLGAARIFRVYHRTDMVPCIPIWPFVHTPSSGQNYYLPSPGIVPLAKFHKMKHYVESVSKQSWLSLARLREHEKTEKDVLEWLKQDTLFGLTISSIEWLNQAIMYVLEKCVGGAIFLVAQGVSSAFTLMDRLAYLLNQGARFAEDLASWVLYLMRKIMTAIGLKRTVQAADLTHEFIRSVLLQLQQRVNQMANRTLNEVLADGRAV